MMDQTWVKSGVATLSVLVIVLLLRQLVVHSLRASPVPVELRRRWTLLIRNISIVVFLAGLGVIWEEQLRTLALSFLAVAAAFVLATKELIACAVGAVVRTSTGHVSLGDRIEVKGMRGDVIDLGLLTTSLAEIGPGPSVHQSTGRIIVIPNSIFLGESIFNESYSDGFVFHSISVPIAPEADWKEAEERLLAAARREYEGYAEKARLAIHRASEGHNIETPSIEPRTWIHLLANDKMQIIVRFVAPTRARGRIEQAIMRSYLSHRVTVGNVLEDPAPAPGPAPAPAPGEAP